MKTLYLDCSMGAAGDMLTAALIELLDDSEKFVDELNALNLPGVTFSKEKSQKCGITGSHMKVLVKGQEEESVDYDLDRKHNHNHHSHNHANKHSDHNHDHDHNHDEHQHTHGHDDHDHAHRGMAEIEHIVMDHLDISKKIKDDIMAVYKLIGEAESQVHGVAIKEIHFHEVGTLDAIADITAVCMLMDKINPDEVVVSPIHVGSGHVKCAHGILPVPAPATALILKGLPIYSANIKGELCTPTGAALLKHFASRFADMPMMRVTDIGYGMGKKDFEVANCVRAMLGLAEESVSEIYELTCNIDDMTGESFGFAMDRFFEEGALDVYTSAINMKKSRPGIKIHVLCNEDNKEKIVASIFKYTTTIGIRETSYKKHVLNREIVNVDTSFGSIRCKISKGYGVTRKKYEYNDISRLAKKNNLSIGELTEKINNL